MIHCINCVICIYIKLFEVTFSILPRCFVLSSELSRGWPHLATLVRDGVANHGSPHTKPLAISILPRSLKSEPLGHEICTIFQAELFHLLIDVTSVQVTRPSSESASPCMSDDVTTVYECFQGTPTSITRIQKNVHMDIFDKMTRLKILYRHSAVCSMYFGLQKGMRQQNWVNTQGNYEICH